jgi:hypothetical protein
MADRWGSQIRAWQKKRDERIGQVFEESKQEVIRSVIDGSELTGAPGQGHRDSLHKRSWFERTIGRFRWQFTTPIPYAPRIESRYHSVAKTRTGWARIIEAVASRVAGQ